MKILLVDDNEMNLDMLSRRLHRKGYQVLVLAQGSLVRRKAIEEQPAVVLLDMGLPDMDGYEVARQMKASPDTASIPVIALTAHSGQADRMKAIEAGCDEFDTKPVDLERLLEKIEAMSARRKIACGG